MIKLNFNIINNNKAIILILSIFISCLFTGCSQFDFETQNIMIPPKPLNEKGEIQNAIDNISGKNITLKYPQKGDNRSAITMHDINADGIDEVIVCYRKNDDDMTHILIMGNINNIWTEISNFTHENDDVERICFGDIDGDGNDEIIIGWNNAKKSENSISLYNYKDNNIKETIFKETYREMMLKDFNNDKTAELFIITTQDPKKNNNQATNQQVDNNQLYATLSKINITDKKLSLITSTKISDYFSKNACALYGKLSDIYNGFIIYEDIRKDYSITDIVFFDPIENEFSTQTAVTLSTGAYSTNTNDLIPMPKDIDNDGIIEIPELFSFYSAQEHANIGSITKWYKYNSPSEKQIVKEYINNYKEGYAFNIPKKWKTSDPNYSLNYNPQYYGPYSIFSYNENDFQTIAFQVYSSKLDLFKIHVFSRSEWGNLNNNKFFEITSKKDKVYVCENIKPDHELGLSNEEIKSHFEFLDDFLDLV